jgi:hypothetical protein
MSQQMRLLIRRSQRYYTVYIEIFLKKREEQTATILITKKFNVYKINGSCGILVINRIKLKYFKLLTHIL